MTDMRMTTAESDAAAVVAGLMPALRAGPRGARRGSRRSPSPASTPGPLHEAHDMVAALLRDAGAEVSTLSLPDTAPCVIGEIPAPPGAPTVLLYSHYDVVPAGDESLWTTPAFEPTERDGALYGRGTSDSKANVLMHVGALRAFDGRPPVGVKLVIEGQEEVGSALNLYPLENPDFFRSDAMLIGDMGSVRPGVPTLTVALRGMAMATIELTTLGGAKHSGQYGGAAPDALLAVLRALAIAARRARRRGRGRTAARGVGRRDLRGRGVPGAGGDRRRAAAARHRRAGLAPVDRPGDHRHGDRRAVGRRAR